MLNKCCIDKWQGVEDNSISTWLVLKIRISAISLEGMIRLLESTLLCFVAHVHHCTGLGRVSLLTRNHQELKFCTFSQTIQ